MDPKKLEKFIQLLKKHDLAELEVESEDERFKIKARSFGDGRAEQGHYNAMPMVSMPAARAMSGERAAGSVQEDSASASSSPSLANIPSGKQVKSPLVGTFYGASSPEAESFVKVGSRIKKGDTLCIVEAMKIMNEIESEEDGIIKAVLVQNGEAVEFNQPLFVLE